MWAMATDTTTERRPRVLIAEPIADAGIELLRQELDVDVAVGVDRHELEERIAAADALVVRSATKVDRALIEAAPHLKVIGRAGIGVDNIDLAAATEHGVLVVNAPTANIISAAEHTLALMLAQARSIPAADASMRAGRWDRKRFQGVELHGKTLGVVGLGRIGTLVAQRASAFGMRLVAYDPYVSEERGRRLGVEMVDLDELLATADFITVHLPLTRETEGLIGADALAKVKPGVRIVNASRGGIVDEDALVEAIRSGRVAGAALDVFATEPLPADSPLRSMPEVVLTPHLGASTVEAQDKAGVAVAEAVAAALRGELVLSAVNVDLGPDIADETREFLPLVEHLGRVFVALAQGLPDRLEVRAVGRVAEHPVRPLRLAALKGVLDSISTEPVTYVNAPGLAADRGVQVVEQATVETVDFVSLVQLRGVVGGREVTVSGTMGRKGPMLVEVLGHEFELPLSRNLLIVRNADIPGMIGKVGMFLGELGVNIANMVVGRSPVTGQAAMMGIALDQPVDDDQLEALRRVEGVEDARFVELPV